MGEQMLIIVSQGARCAGRYNRLPHFLLPFWHEIHHLYKKIDEVSRFTVSQALLLSNENITVGVGKNLEASHQAFVQDACQPSCHFCLAWQLLSDKLPGKTEVVLY